MAEGTLRADSAPSDHATELAGPRATPCARTMARRRTLADRIEIRSIVTLGKPVIRGTRITGEHVLELLASGRSIPAILRDPPKLDRSDVLAALDHARRALGTGHVIPRTRSA